MEWDVVATAPDQMTAEMWSSMLGDNGVQCRLHPGDTSGFLGISPHSVRILAPSDNVEEARRILDGILGNEAGGET